MIYYISGYKYQLAKHYVHELPFAINVNVDTPFLKLASIGNILQCRYGYAWDGPSGPTFDTPAFMRGSLVHDALYQLIRQGYLPEDPYRRLADEELYRICREDGMGWIRAQYVYAAVRWFGKSAATKPRKILVAPRKE